MRFLLLGDLHITDKRPGKRTDDNYLETILGKLKYVLEYAQDNNIDQIIQPGDFFDTPKASINCICQVLGIINDYNIPIFTIYGQHDMNYHHDIKNSPLTLLSLCTDLIELPGKSSLIHGYSFGETISENEIGIGVAHTMVVDEKLWEKQEDFVYGNHLLRNTKFDLLVTGDNHKSFVMKYGSKWLVNCGSLMRSNIGQLNHKPMFCVYDVSDRSIEKHYIPINENVFDTEKIEKMKSIDSEMLSFIESLNTCSTQSDYVQNLREYCKANKVEEDVQTIINSFLEGE